MIPSFVRVRLAVGKFRRIELLAYCVDRLKIIAGESNVSRISASDSSASVSGEKSVNDVL
ncbi:hypothetical protein [Undibacterium sp. RuTC16W]|uniref:hypothetical protein n=1 Tax=Undibacterium sp. RuTC16W TaxID=3413048 RepID=UPI003BF0EF08